MRIWLFRPGLMDTFYTVGGQYADWYILRDYRFAIAIMSSV